MSLRNRLQTRHPDLLGILRLVRWEWQLAEVRLVSRFSPNQIRLRRRFRNARGLKVHLACGPNRVEGWVNIDGSPDADLRIDLRSRIPLPSGSAACIFTEHFIDHLQHPDSVGALLRECHRLLQPGGTMRVVVHDGELLMRAYVSKDTEFFRRVVETGTFALDESSLPLEVINEVFRYSGTHRFIFDFETLEKTLHRAGFSSVQRSSFRGSLMPECNLDLDLPDREIQSLYVDAVK